MTDENLSPYRLIKLAAGLIFILGSVLIFALNLKHAYDDKLADAAGAGRNMAIAAEHYVAATIDRTDSVLNRLVDEFSPGHQEKWLSPQKISSKLLTLQTKQPELKSLHIADGNGNVIYTFLDGGGYVFPPFLGEEAFFAAHRANPNPGLLLSVPVPADQAREHTDFGRNLIISRRLNNPAGGFAGVAAATISLIPFEGFYASLNPGDNAVLTLLNEKRAILARFPAGAGFSGKSLTGGDLDASMQANPRGGTYSGVSIEDGVERISSFRQVGELPLYIHVGLTKQGILATWRRNALINCAVIAGLLAVILLLSYGGLQRSDDKRKDVREAYAIASEVSELRRSERLLKFENHVLEIVCGNMNLSATLVLLCRGMESIMDESLCTVMLLDEDGLHLRFGAAPSLPSGYKQAIDGLVVGANAGSCGTAAYTGRPVIAGDIARDPLWENDKKLALSYDLAACHSTPIYSETDNLLGIFAVYYRKPYQPSPLDLQAAGRAARLAGIVIRNKRTADTPEQPKMDVVQA